ncbi:MAG: class I SAM-dependent methyltransferase [Solirubrobacterales bacterium]
MAEHPIFARLYDRITALEERAGLAEERRRLLSGASGRTLEIGSGTGHNLSHYTEAVSELVLAEPDPHMAKRLRAKLAAQPPLAGPARVIETPAEQLPFDNGAFDTVVSTLVLCTVQDPAAAVRELKRVLVDGGALIFIEHVRADEARVARIQDWIERPWGWFFGGCHPNRPSIDRIIEAGFWIERLERRPLPGAPKRLVPMISGVARRPTGAGDPDY